MATWDSAYLLGLFNRYAGRPTVDEITDVEKYKWLTEGQAGIVADIAARCPWVLYGAPALLVTADSKVFTFGTDSNGYAVFPFGNVRIFPSLQAVPDNPWREGRDYLSEGTQIRLPNDRTYSGALYWRGITQPADITASTQPSLFPEASRDLIAIDAARRFVKTLNRPADDLQRDYDRGLVRWLLVWRRQFSNGGALRGNGGILDNNENGYLLGDSGLVLGDGGGILI